AAGKLLKTLAEDLLGMIAVDDRLVERQAIEPGRDRGLRNPLGCGLGFDAGEPGIKVAGAAGGCGERWLAGQGDRCAGCNGANQTMVDRFEQPGLSPIHSKS